MLNICITCQFSEDMPHGCMGHGGSCHNITDAVIATEEGEEIQEPIGGWNPEAEGVTDHDKEAVETDFEGMSKFYYQLGSLWPNGDG